MYIHAYTYIYTLTYTSSAGWRHGSVTSVFAYIVKELSSLITGKIKPSKLLFLNDLCILL